MSDIFESTMPEEYYQAELSEAQYKFSVAMDLITDLYDAFCLSENEYVESCPYTELSIKTNEFITSIRNSNK